MIRLYFQIQETRRKGEKMKDGFYTAKTENSAPHFIIAVHDNQAIPYSISWYGDLGQWEIYSYREAGRNSEIVDVSSFSDNEYPEMIANIIHVYWDEVYVDKYEVDFVDAPSPEEVLEWWEENFD